MMKYQFLLNKRRWLRRKHEGNQAVKFGMTNDLVELHLLDYMVFYIYTSKSKPSVSLLKAICYPGAAKFFWCGVYGCQHEDEARSIYGEMMKKDHDTFTISQYGVLLDPTNPFMGASPDGVV